MGQVKDIDIEELYHAKGTEDMLIQTYLYSVVIRLVATLFSSLLSASKLGGTLFTCQ